MYDIVIYGISDRKKSLSIVIAWNRYISITYPTYFNLDSLAGLLQIKSTILKPEKDRLTIYIL